MKSKFPSKRNPPVRATNGWRRPQLEALEPRWLFSTTASVVIRVVPLAEINRAHVIVGMPKLAEISDGTVNFGSTFTCQAKATGSPAPTYALTGAPAGMVIDASTGLITWTPTLSQVGETETLVTASNSLGSSSQSFSVIVTDYVAPVIAPPPSLLATAGGAFAYQLSATGTPAPAFSLVSGPAGLTVDASGLLAWNPPAATPFGPQSVTVAASNLAGTTSSTFAITVGADTTPPTAPVVTVGPITAVDAIPLSFTATDDIGVAGYRIYTYTPAVYKGHSGRGGGYTLVSPAKYTLLADHVTDNSYTVTGLAPDTLYRYAVAAYDAAGNQSPYSAVVTGTTYSQPTFYWTSDGVNQNPPLSVVANHTLTFYLFTTGNPSPDLTLVAAPDGAVYTPQVITNSQLTMVTAHVTWTPTADQTGVQTITMQATNAVGTYTYAIPVTVTPDTPQLSVSLNGGITYSSGQFASGPATYQVVVNPAFGSAANPQYGLSNTPFNFQVTAVSNTNPTTFALLSGPDGMTLDPNTGAGTWTPTKAQAGTTGVLIAATNDAGTSTLSLTFPTYFTDAPGMPVANYVTSVSGQLTNNPTMTWTPPADTQGIVGYTLAVTDAHTNVTTNFDTQSTATSYTLSGLGAQQYFVTVTPYDAGGNPGMASPAMSIYGAAMPTVSWAASTSTAVVGVPMTVQFAEPYSGFTYSIVSGPAGAAIDPATGLLTFTPTAAGNAAFVVAGTNPNGWGNVDAVLNLPVYFADAPAAVAVAITADPATSAPVVTVSWSVPLVNAAAVAGYQVSVLPAGSAVPLVVEVGSASPLSLVLSDLGVTTGSVQVAAVDALGNVGAASGWLAF